MLSRVRYTYSLGFFFGPGLPRSLGGALGSIIGAALLRPAAAPPLFRLPSTFGGGASELGSGVSAPVAGTGVAALESSGFEAGEGSGCVIVGAGSRVLAPGVDEDASRDEDPEPDVNFARCLDARWTVTISVFPREPFGVDLAGVAMGVVVMVLFPVDIARVVSWLGRYGEVAAHSRGCEWVLGLRQPSLCRGRRVECSRGCSSGGR